MALKQGKYSALGTALGQYRTSLYDVMEKEHEKEFISWKGERERDQIKGGFAAVSKGVDMIQKLMDKSAQADATRKYLQAELDKEHQSLHLVGGGDYEEQSIFSKIGQTLGIKEEKYQVGGEGTEYGMTDLTAAAQFHKASTLEDMMSSKPPSSVKEGSPMPGNNGEAESEYQTEFSGMEGYMYTDMFGNPVWEYGKDPSKKRSNGGGM
jgi:hypothetical protein